MTSLIVYLKEHHALRQSIFHLIGLPLVFYTSLAPGFASGPCNPGTGFMTYALIFIIDIVLVPLSFILFVLKGKSWRTAFFINIAAFVILLAMGTMHR